MPSRLAQHLVSRGLLSQEQAGELLRQHQAQGGHLDTALMERGMSEQDVLAMLGEASGFRPVNLVDFEPNQEVATFIPPKIAERLSVVPLSLDGTTLHVACAYPVPKKELDEVGFLLGKPLELWVAIELRVREWISIIYRQPLPPRFVQLGDALAAQQAGSHTPPPPPPPEDESMSVDMVEQLARSVAQEPVAPEGRPAAPREPAPADIPPPAYVREPLRLNTSAGPVTSARAVQRPTPPPAPADIPPPAYVREPLRLNMPGTPARATPAAQPPPAATPPNRSATAPAGGAPPTLHPPGERPPPPPQAVPVLTPVGPATPQAPTTAGIPPQPRAAPPQAPGQPPSARPSTPQASGRGINTDGVSGVTGPQGTSVSAPPASAQGVRPGASAQATPPPSAAAQAQNARPGASAPTAPAQGPSGTQPPATAPQPSAQGARQGPTAPPQAPGARAPATTPVWPPAPAQQAREAARAATPTPPPVPPTPPRGEPSFIIFSNPASNPGAARPRGAPEGAAPVPGASSAPGAPVPDWTLPQARSALREATRDRDRLVDVALRFGRRTFDYVAAFAVVRGAAGGWDARGEGLDASALSQVSIPLDASSVFRTVAVTRGSYAGPLPPDALTRHYLELFGRQAPRTVFLYPVEVKGRLVAILYGDCGQKPMSQRRLSDYILFCQDLPAAFQELILFRKQRVAELRAPEEEDISIDVDVPGFPAASLPAPAPAVVAGLGWSPFFGRGGVANLGRAAAMPPRVLSPEERPPPDFAPLLRRLTGPDAAQRSSAMAELARSPEASARVLAQHFPGPTAWSRLPVVELPEADELGPIPAALSRLGRPAAVALAPLLDSNDADARYLALLTAGNLPYAELVDGVLRGLFDMEPDISSAARVAAAALKHLPRLDASLRDLRQELTSRDALRRSLAARALGTLHDRDAIEGLINLTGSDDAMCAQAAAEALREVTRATLGLQPRQWTSWWAENRSRRRADWLVAALRHRELDVRLAAIEELSRALHDTLGYYADAPDAEREAAVRRWEAAAVDPANARRLGML
ncbi:FrgA protein [Corallococcus sp. BB11-1]|uniref:GspE/PulE/PilB domain-containing protein n=1 Tax=Corallococcus sp. BB11-1 TaxID=2996783 RepID=UPI00226EC267|nr:FrgA protein [Corallococcus sp. BB11-1]MCY1036242.1 FrgA protein [Corallococcus sp. BB11-1]